MVQNDNITPDPWDGTVYGRILDSRVGFRRGDYTTKDVVALDRAIGAAPDRMKRAIYYTEAYVFARDAGFRTADDAIVAVVEAEVEPSGVDVVTSDRGLQARVQALGSGVSSPRALLDALDAEEPSAD